MQDLGLREITIHQPVHSRPRPCRSAVLTASAQLMEPELCDFGNEFIEPAVVIGNSVVTQPSTNHTCQPATGDAHWIVTGLAKFRFDHLQRSGKPLATGTPPKDKPFVLLGLSTDVCEAKKFKRLARPPAFTLTTCSRVATEFDQASFVGMQLETELCQPLFQRIEAGVCFCFVLETDLRPFEEGRSRWLIVLRKTLSFSIPSRFIPALSGFVFGFPCDRILGVRFRLRIA